MSEYSSEQWEVLLTELLTRSNRPGHFSSEAGMKVTNIQRGYLEAELTATEQLCNPRGIVHGGILYTLMDHMSGVVACTTGKGCVTLSSSVNYFRPAVPGDHIVCKARVVKPGSRVTVCEASVYSDAGKELARGSFTYYMTEELTETVRLCSDFTDSANK